MKFEEATQFTLLSRSLRVLSSRSLGWPYQSWLLSGFRVVDARNFEAMFGDDEKWSISIRARGIPYVYPRIGCRECASDAHSAASALRPTAAGGTSTMRGE